MDQVSSGAVGGLTTLADHGLSHQSWAGLPSLQYLHVNTCPPTLDRIAALSSLRGLALSLGPDGSGLTSLDPLSSLHRLERLGLIDRALPIPALTSLTRLSLDYVYANGEFPFMPASPSLKQLDIALNGQLHLPDLAVLFPSLQLLSYDDRAGRLTISIADKAGRFKSQRITKSLRLIHVP